MFYLLACLYGFFTGKFGGNTCTSSWQTNNAVQMNRFLCWIYLDLLDYTNCSGVFNRFAGFVYFNQIRVKESHSFTNSNFNYIQQEKIQQERVKMERKMHSLPYRCIYGMIWIFAQINNK